MGAHAGTGAAVRRTRRARRRRRRSSSTPPQQAHCLCTHKLLVHAQPRCRVHARNAPPGTHAPRAQEVPFTSTRVESVLSPQYTLSPTASGPLGASPTSGGTLASHMQPFSPLTHPPKHVTMGSSPPPSGSNLLSPPGGVSAAANCLLTTPGILNKIDEGPASPTHSHDLAQHAPPVASAAQAAQAALAAQAEDSGEDDVQVRRGWARRGSPSGAAAGHGGPRVARLHAAPRRVGWALHTHMSTPTHTRTRTRPPQAGPDASKLRSRMELIRAELGEGEGVSALLGSAAQRGGKGVVAVEEESLVLSDDDGYGGERHGGGGVC